MIRLTQCVVAVLLVLTIVAHQLPAGPAIGTRLSQFNVRDCSGPAAGKSLCYFCRYGSRPVVCLFTRKITPAVSQLIQKLDQQVGEHRRDRLAAFVVVLAEDTAAVERSLKQLAAELELRYVPLTIYRDSALKLQRLLQLEDEAALEVLSWRRSQVLTNRIYRDGKLTAKDQADVIGDALHLLGGRRAP